MISTTEKILSNIDEYRNLLRFLSEKHPEVIDEWKIKALGLNQESPAPDDDDPTIIPEQTRNDSQEINRESY